MPATGEVYELVKTSNPVRVFRGVVDAVQRRGRGAQVRGPGVRRVGTGTRAGEYRSVRLLGSLGEQVTPRRPRRGRGGGGGVGDIHLRKATRPAAAGFGRRVDAGGGPPRPPLTPSTGPRSGSEASVRTEGRSKGPRGKTFGVEEEHAGGVPVPYVGPSPRPLPRHLSPRPRPKSGQDREDLGGESGSRRNRLFAPKRRRPQPRPW